MATKSVRDVTGSGALINTVRSIILDFQESRPDTGVPRRLQIEPVAGKAAVCVGVRRSGKSTYLYQIVERLVSHGVPRENVLYLNLFDDRLHDLRADNIGTILDAYYSIYPQKKDREVLYCFFDEVQAIAGWEPFVDRLMRTEKCEVYLTGSSARMLSTEIATQMRGRALAWEIFPFSFREYLDYAKVQSEGALSTKQRLLVQKAFDDYMEVGGFPEVVSLRQSLRVAIHQEYFHTVLFRDLVERYDVAHPRAVVDLARRLVDNTASRYSLNSVTGYLQSLGHRAPKSSVADYLGWLEDAYFLFSIRLYDASLARSNANPKTVYCIDHSLVRSVSSGILVNSGHLLENAVFIALRRLHRSVWYYRTRNGREVDFVVPKRGATALLIQVCESLAAPETRKRETAGLVEAMEELGVRNGTIVTRNEDGQIEAGSGAIEVIPAWRYLLEAERAVE